MQLQRCLQKRNGLLIIITCQPAGPRGELVEPMDIDIPGWDVQPVGAAARSPTRDATPCPRYRGHEGGARRGGPRRWFPELGGAWRDVKLPDGKVIAPGVVSHSTNVVEHPELLWR
jgi:hypothetical protein